MSDEILQAAMDANEEIMLLKRRISEQAMHIEELERRWDDIPWEEIEALILPNAMLSHSWTGQTNELIRRILALKEQSSE